MLGCGSWVICKITLKLCSPNSDWIRDVFIQPEKRDINWCAVCRRLGENESTFDAWQIPRYLKMLNWQRCAMGGLVIDKMLANQILGHLIALVVAVVGPDVQRILFWIFRYVGLQLLIGPTIGYARIFRYKCNLIGESISWRSHHFDFRFFFLLTFIDGRR